VTTPHSQPLIPAPPLPSHRLSVLISEEEIQKRIEELSQELAADFRVHFEEEP
jgi:hypoxanthine-guanine phosphoribosyltransferase